MEERGGDDGGTCGEEVSEMMMTIRVIMAMVRIT